jgi:hypothetical protein
MAVTRRFSLSKKEELRVRKKEEGRFILPV